MKSGPNKNKRNEGKKAVGSRMKLKGNLMNARLIGQEHGTNTGHTHQPSIHPSDDILARQDGQQCGV
jgi:hypothetical protein